jgi:hypothetical protein
MYLGFEFEPSQALEVCKEYLLSGFDIDIEHLETQRASIQNMLKLYPSMKDNDRDQLVQTEKLIYNYLVDHGGISSPVLNDEALGGDLVHIPYNSTGPS